MAEMFLATQVVVWPDKINTGRAGTTGRGKPRLVFSIFREIFGPDIEEESVDAFDRGRIGHGGAFELGKSRKH
jgi:hypothetical protein